MRRTISPLPGLLYGPIPVAAALLSLLPALADADAGGPAASPGAASAATPAAKIDIRGQATLDEARLYQAIAHELRSAGMRADCRLAVDFLASDQVQVSWTCAGEGVSRVVSLPERAEDKIQTIAFLAGNLAHDQASTLIAGMAPAPAPAQAPAPSMSQAPGATAGPGAATAAPTGPAPGGPAPGGPESAGPAPTGPAPTGAVLEAEVTIQTPRNIPLSLSLVMPVSTDLLFGRGPVVHGGSLSAIASAGHGLDGVAVAGVADVRTNFTHGVQIAGVATYTGNHMRGAQVAGVGAVAGTVEGAQIAGVVTTARQVEGIQIAGAVTTAKHVDGVQVAGALNVAGTVEGAQIGTINVARDPRGLQLGVINVAGTPDGVPVGVFSFVKGGPVRLDGWVESTGISAVALRHGSRRWHNIYAVGTVRVNDEYRPLYGLGMGSHTSLSPRMSLDVDALSWVLVGQNAYQRISQLEQLRLTLIADLGPASVFGGAAMNVYISEYDQGDDLSPHLDKQYDVSGTAVRLWPSVHAGVRFD